MKLRDLKFSDLWNTPARRTIVGMATTIVTGVGIVAGGQRFIDTTIAGWNGQLSEMARTTASLSATTGALTVANATLSEQTRALAAQMQNLNGAIDAEANARKSESGVIADKLAQSERSRRAEENGLVQRIDQLMLMMRPGSWSPPDKRGDAGDGGGGLPPPG